MRSEPPPAPSALGPFQGGIYLKIQQRVSPLNLSCCLTPGRRNMSASPYGRSTCTTGGLPICAITGLRTIPPAILRVANIDGGAAKGLRPLTRLHLRPAVTRPL